MQTESGKARLRVVQCWDDGVTTDERLCDILRRHRAKASFNLNPGLHRPERWGDWIYKDRFPVLKLAWGELREVYRGFTIANHSMNHPHPTRIPAEAWRAEVVDARKRLQDHFGQEVAGFAWPYGEHDEPRRRIVAEAGHLYARSVGRGGPFLPPPDPMAFDPSCHFQDPEFMELYRQAKEGSARAFYFWGHSYEMTEEWQWKAFEEKIASISADPEAEWAEVAELLSGPPRDR